MHSLKPILVGIYGNLPTNGITDNTLIRKNLDPGLPAKIDAKTSRLNQSQCTFLVQTDYKNKDEFRCRLRQQCCLFT